MGWGFATLLLTLSCATSCASPTPRPRWEDRSRRVAPLPACLLRLPPRRAPSSGAARSIREEQYWKLVFPSFDLHKRLLPTNALDCTSKAPFTNKAVFGAPTPEPNFEVKEGDVSYGGGGDRLKVVWLRTHHWKDGTASGVLAVARTLESHAEAYATGSLRGPSERTRLGIKRMGPEVMVTARDDTCKGRKPGKPCRTLVHVFLARKGTLVRVADIDLERVEYAVGTEPGIAGQIEYRLTTAPTYKKEGIHLFEQITVLDSSENELRKAQLDRMILLTDKGMYPSDDPLWPRIFRAAATD